MTWSSLWPWRWVHGPAQLQASRSTTLPVLEILEDRLAPSTTTTNYSAAYYEMWRHQKFTLDHQKPIFPTLQSSSLAGQSAAATAQNASFGSLIGLSTAFAAHPSISGQGYSVAVIDTGIDYLNPNLGGGFGPGYKVIAGYNFVNNTANPYDDNGHGTAVAGIIASSNATYSGIAPNVNLIALKALDASGSGTYGAIQNALNWVVANEAKYNIVAVNMSLGSGNYTVSPYTFLDSDFSALVKGGVFISVAAGNGYYSNSSQMGLSFPAVDPYVVSVGAVYAGSYGSLAWGDGAIDYTTAPDIIASFSQRSAALGMMAPGAMITTTYLNNTFASMAGTSMAAPVITGAAVLIHQQMDAMHQSANESSILKDMQATGATVVDGNNENNNVVHTGLAFKRINVAAALDAVNVSAPPVLHPITSVTLTAGNSTTIRLNGSDPAGYSLTYSASQLSSTTALAYQLRGQLGLTYPGSYYINMWGQNEKWMTSTTGNWYCILSTGAVYRWAGSMAATLLPANWIATLDPSFYADPSQLWNAQPGSAALTLTMSGNQLIVQAPAGATGSFQVQVLVSDGSQTATQIFTVTIQKAPLQLGAIATQAMFSNRSQTLTLSLTNAQSQQITYTAQVLGTFGTLPATLVISGNQLTIYTSPAFAGSFTVQVTGSDGLSSCNTAFQVNVAASPVANVLTGDFLGNGRQDTVFYNADGSCWVSMPQANGTFINQMWVQWTPAVNLRLFQVGDFNGDGKMDIIGYAYNGCWYVGLSTGSGFWTQLWAQWSLPANWSYVQVGNFNGDGKTDIIGFNQGGSWWVGLSTGSSFAMNLWTQWSGASSWSSVQLLDVDGNGLLDIVGYNNLLSKWYVGYSTGQSFLTGTWPAGKATPSAGAATSSSVLSSHVETASAGFDLLAELPELAALGSKRNLFEW